MTRFSRTLALGFALSAWGGAVWADTLPVEADTYARTDPRDVDPLSPSGAAPIVHVRNGLAGPLYSGYARFDLSALPAGASVEKATLRLWVNDVSREGAVAVVPVLEEWDEASLTPALHPATGDPVASAPVTGADVGRYVSLDVTDLVAAWVSGALTNNGVALVGDAAGVDARFDSKENAATSRPMEIEVVITSVGPQGPAGPQGATGPQGAQGIQGPPGLSSVVLTTIFETLPPSSLWSRGLTCDGGRRVLSGGVRILTQISSNEKAQITIHESGPSDIVTWQFEVSNRNSIDVSIELSILCALAN